MKNKNYLTDLKNIQEMTSQIRNFNLHGVLNEGIMFNEEFDDEEYSNMDEYPQDDEPQMGQQPNGGYEQEEQPQGQPMDVEKAKPEEEGMRELDEMGAIDKIREIALQGMQKFAKQPEHPQYQALRKVLQLVDKAVDDDIKNQQQPQ